MRSHVDWVTFTGNPIYEGGDEFPRAVLNGVHALIGTELMDALLAGDSQQRERSRAPYTYAWGWDESDVTIFASPSLNHFTVEISGQGCERLIALNALQGVLERVQERVTRVDVATDIETPVMPLEFVSVRSHERMRSSGYQKSETGETCYVGSKKSDRYARVYRYVSPHPRSHLLRVECVFRRDTAKLVAGAISREGVRVVAESAREIYGFAHQCWEQISTNEIDLSPVRAESGGGKTIHWLLHSVAPAFKRLVADGTIRDPQAFLAEFFIGEDGTHA